MTRPTSLKDFSEIPQSNKNIILEIPGGGPKFITEDEAIEIVKSVRDVMQHIIHDPAIDPTKMTDAQIRASGLSHSQISELLRLKHVSDEVQSGKPIIKANVLAEMKDIN